MHVDRGAEHDRLSSFKGAVAKSVVFDRFTTPDDLAFKASAALGRFLVTVSVRRGLEANAWSQSISTPVGRGQVSRRAARINAIIRGSSVLIIADDLESMHNLAEIMEDLGIKVIMEETTTAALRRLEIAKIDAIVSDMRRGSVPDEGIRFLKKARDLGQDKPTVFFVESIDYARGTPPYSFGITNRLDETLNLVFDILERVRG